MVGHLRYRFLRIVLNKRYVRNKDRTSNVENRFETFT